MSRNTTLLSHVNSYGGYAALCSYRHSDGREYAVLGTTTGTAIYNLSNPVVPVLVGFIPGPTSGWREMKQYGNHLYVVSEGTGAGSGLQIIRMANPQSPVLAVTDTSSFRTAHTISVDTARGILYANGAHGANGSPDGMHVLSLANPEAPSKIGVYIVHYVHDTHIRGMQVYLACINEGIEVVLDMTNPASPVELASWSTPGDFTHNSWTSDNGQYLYTTDENSNGFLTVYDISNLASVMRVGQFVANPDAIVHNVRVKGDTAFVSYYTEGVRLLDISEPTTPAEFGYYDTWSGPSGGYNGDWDVDPFLPSGLILLSDISTGLYVIRSNPNYGILVGNITERPSGLLSDGALVILDGGSASYLTSALGRYRFAPDPGTHSAQISKFGFYATSISGPVALSSVTQRDVDLFQKPQGTLNGVIKNAVTSNPVGDALITLLDTPLATMSMGDGSYAFSSVPEGNYVQAVDRAGYAPARRGAQITGNTVKAANIDLNPMAFYYDVESAAGWSPSAAGDNALTGLWIRADPVGSGAPPNYVQPEDDHTPSPGTVCFVTGNGPVGGSIGAQDVDGGKTTLLSPNWNLTGLSDPHIAFYYWYVNDAGSNPGEDPFVISISSNGGASWLPVDSLYASTYAWRLYDFAVTDYVPLTTNIKLRFIAQDLGGGSVVEAAVDDIGYYAASAQIGIGDETPHVLGSLFASPNPFLTEVDLRLALPGPTALSVRVFDVNGRLVRRLYEGQPGGDWELRWDGRNEEGQLVPGGIYFIRAKSKSFQRVVRVVRTQ